MAAAIATGAAARAGQWTADQPAERCPVHRHAGHDDHVPGHGEDRGRRDDRAADAVAESRLDSGAGAARRRSPSGCWSRRACGCWRLLAILLAGVLRYSVFSRHVFAIGSNEATARLCGINVAAHEGAGLSAGGAVRGHGGHLPVRAAAQRQSDLRTGSGAEGDRRGGHRRRQPERRTRHRAGHAHRARRSCRPSPAAARS